MAIILLISASAAAQNVTVRQEKHMGAYVTINVAAPESKEVLAAIEAGFAEVKRLEKALSERHTSSQTAKVNRRAGRGAVKVGKELFQLLKMARDVSAKSEGAFDVTFAALEKLWNYKDPRFPAEKEIKKRIRLVDYRQLVLNEKARSVKLKKKGMRAGLGGIAKGYILDRVSAVLKKQGYPDHLIIAGGDLYASGTRGGQKWRVGIRNPKNRGLYATIEVENEGVATSNNYEKFFFKDGLRYHHILDPQTGWPARGTAAVTVVAKSAALADAYATALFVLGPEKALKLAAQQGLGAFIFDETFQTSATPGMQKRIQRAQPSP